MAGKRFHLVIRGLVQGVSFRVYARDEAKRLHLLGWVKNLPNGDVEAICEGEDIKLKEFEDWCRRTGSPESRIESVLLETLPATGEFTSFAIR